MTDRPESPGRRWYRRPKIVIALSVLAAVIIGLSVWEPLCGSRLDRALADTRAVDPLLTLDEIIASLPPIPDDRNGMRVVEGIEDELDTIQKNEDNSLDPLPIVGKADTPPLGERPDDAMLAAVTAKLDEIAGVISEIDRLADYDDGRRDLVITEDPIDMLLPHLSQLRLAAKLERLDMLRHAAAGDGDAVLGDLEAMATVGRLVDDEPTLISTLVSVATDALCVEASQAALAQCDFSPAQLARLDAILARLRSPDRLYHGMRGERAFFLGIMDSVRSNPSALTSVSSGGIPSLYTRLPGLRGLFRCDVAYGIDYYTRLLQATRSRDLDREKLKELERSVEDTPRHFLFSRIMLPSLTRAMQLDARNSATVDASRVGVALERYRMDHGAWPTKLDALVPDYLDTVPADPFSGGPLRYLVDENCVVVYSVDENGKDDGGDVTDHRIAEAGKEPGDTPGAPSTGPSATRRQPKDWGFVLLNPDQRNRPPAPSTLPASE